MSAPRVASPVMIGRENELHALDGFARGLSSGVPGVALIGGRAGMGKTRLVSEATGRWEAQRCRVIVGRCVPVEATPYLPLASALRRAVPSNSPVLRMLTSPPEISRTDLFESLTATLDGLAAPDPLILVVDDLHWSDRATRDALSYMVSQSRGGRWGLVGTHRYDGPLSTEEFESFADAMSRLSPVHRITTEPLTPTQVAEMAAGITGALPGQAEALGVDVTEVANALRRARDAHLIEVDAGGYPGVPVTLRPRHTVGFTRLAMA